MFIHHRHLKSGNPGRQGSRLALFVRARADGDLELHLRPARAELEHVARVQQDLTVDPTTVHVGAIAAPEIDQQKQRGVPIHRNQARMVASDGGIATGVESHGGGRRAPENQFLVGAERHRVDFRGSGAGEVAEDDIDHDAPPRGLCMP